MKNIGDIFAERQGRLDEGRTVLARLQAVFDAAFEPNSCFVKLSNQSVVVYVASAAQASAVQMQKHHLVGQLQAIEPLIKTVRITIGLPREPKKS